jgi:hypothetical protein
VHTQLVLQLIVSEDVKQRAQNYLQFSRTERFEELLLAWMRAGPEQSSFSIRLWFLVLEQKLQNFKIEIACQPAAVIRVGIKKGENKGNKSIQVVPTSLWKDK